jgi:hypothetical protein
VTGFYFWWTLQSYLDKDIKNRERFIQANME